MLFGLDLLSYLKILLLNTSVQIKCPLFRANCMSSNYNISTIARLSKLIGIHLFFFCVMCCDINLWFQRWKNVILNLNKQYKILNDFQLIQEQKGAGFKNLHNLMLMLINETCSAQKVRITSQRIWSISQVVTSADPLIISMQCNPLIINLSCRIISLDIKWQ